MKEDEQQKLSLISEKEFKALLGRLQSNAVDKEDYETLKRTARLYFKFIEELKREDVTMEDIRALFSKSPEGNPLI